MSIQENRFADIANAIREKDGTTAPIKALDFAERIRSLSAGGGGGGGGYISVLESYDGNYVVYKGSVRLPEFAAVFCDPGCEVLEEYA